MEQGIVNTNEEPPHRIVELYGGFVLPNRLWRPINVGQVKWNLLLFEESVVNVVANDYRQYIQSQCRNGAQHY